MIAKQQLIARQSLMVCAFLACLINACSNSTPPREIVIHLLQEQATTSSWERYGDLDSIEIDKEGTVDPDQRIFTFPNYEEMTYHDSLNVAYWYVGYTVSFKGGKDCDGWAILKRDTNDNNTWRKHMTWGQQMPITDHESSDCRLRG